MDWELRYAVNDSHGHYQYIHKRGDKWVVVQKGTGKVLSTHDSEESAIASFKAMMMHKHGDKEYNQWDLCSSCGRSKRICKRTNSPECQQARENYQRDNTSLGLYEDNTPRS